MRRSHPSSPCPPAQRSCTMYYSIAIFLQLCLLAAGTTCTLAQEPLKRVTATLAPNGFELGPCRILGDDGSTLLDSNITCFECQAACLENQGRKMSFKPSGARDALVLENPELVPYFKCGPFPVPEDPLQNTCMLLQSSRTESAQLLSYNITTCATCLDSCLGDDACDVMIYAAQVVIKGDDMEGFECKPPITPML